MPYSILKEDEFFKSCVFCFSNSVNNFPDVTSLDKPRLFAKLLFDEMTLPFHKKTLYFTAVTDNFLTLQGRSNVNNILK